MYSIINDEEFDQSHLVVIFMCKETNVGPKSKSRNTRRLLVAYLYLKLAYSQITHKELEDKKPSSAQLLSLFGPVFSSNPLK